jgi:hypothetical protein
LDNKPSICAWCGVNRVARYNDKIKLASGGFALTLIQNILNQGWIKDENISKKKVTIQPYKSRLLITKVHLIAFCEELMANVFQYRFRNAQDIIEVKHSGH